MKNKILNFVNIVYNIFKQEVWPYRYILLLWFLMLTSFTIEMLTYTRLVRFAVICVVLIIYKKLNEVIAVHNFKNFNLKYVILFMKINTWQNLVLYLIWKWDIYMYYKLENLIHKNIKNKWLKRFSIIVLWNLTVPLKIIYLRFYITLNNLKNLTLKAFFFDRIYGFLISILIFSDIIQYIYKVTGGFLNLIIYLYVLLYSINMVYVYYYYFVEKKLQKVNNVKKIMELFKKTIIYKILVNYIFIKDIVVVYEMRIGVSILGMIIKKVLINSFTKKNDENVIPFQENERLKNNILILRAYLYEIPDNWRYWLNFYSLNFIFFFSYFDYNSYINDIYRLELNQEMSNLVFKKKYIMNYYTVYVKTFSSLGELFKALETVLYYKFYILKKGFKETSSFLFVDQQTIKISNIEYEYIYITYLLILKNVLHFIWSFEYNILKDKNKITKFYVIENNYLEFGYHIYLKNINEYHSYDTFSSNLNSINSDIFIEKIDKEHVKYDAVYESVKVLSNLDEYYPSCLYIKYIENEALKNLDTWYYVSREKLRLYNYVENDTSLLKTEIAQEYFSELNNLMAKIREEWELNGELNIYEKRNAFKELSQHLVEIKYFKN